MRHFLNARIRSIYYLSLFFIWIGLTRIFELHTNFLDLLMLMGLFVAYYLFDISVFKKNDKILQKIIISLTLNIGGVIVLSYFKEMRGLPILPIIIFTIIQLILIPIFTKMNRKNIRVAILESGEDANRVRNILSENEEFEYIGYMDRIENDSNYLGSIENIEEIVKKHKIEKIIFTSRKQVKIYADLVMKMKLKGIQVKDYLGFLEKYEGKVDIDKIDSLWVLMTEGFTSLNSSLEKRIKRMFDIFVSLILLIVSFPFMIITYILVKSDGGPALFKQKRIGINGEEFEIIKFRSMKVHDPSKHSKYASENDDRIGKVGHFIRKTRLDELPQLINVFRGEMSFVGPRPEWNELGYNYEKLIKNYNLRYAVRPGVTGWAQTMYSYSSTLEEVKNKLEYDLYYVKNQSLALDMIIMFKTVQTVIFGRGR